MTEHLKPERPEMHPARLSIETHRHLVSDDTREHSGVMEYFDNISGHRVLTIPRLSESASLHRELVNKRVPVYPVIATDDRNLLLDVPNDARTVQSSVRFIARDVAHYKEIFTQVGAVLGRCMLNGFGVPGRRVERSILGSIAFSLDDAEVFGGNVHLLPPYAFDTDTSKMDEIRSIEQELVQSPYVSQAVARELITATSLGWEYGKTH